MVYLHLNMYDMYASYITVVYNISSAIVFSMGRTCCKIITESEPELILHDNLVISYQGPHFHFFFVTNVFLVLISMITTTMNYQLVL